MAIPVHVTPGNDTYNATTDSDVVPDIAGNFFVSSTSTDAGTQRIAQAVLVITGSGQTTDLAYAGNAMTEVFNQTSGGFRVQVWIYENPPSGSAVISGTVPAHTEYSLIVSHYRDVSLTSPLANFAIDSGTGTSPHITASAGSAALLTSIARVATADGFSDPEPGTTIVTTETDPFSEPKAALLEREGPCTSTGVTIAASTAYVIAAWAVNGSGSQTVGSFVSGVTGTVTASRSVLFSIDGNVNTNDTPGLFKIAGDLEVTGTIGGGSIALDDLSDVAIASPAALDVLAYSGSEWVNTEPIVRRATLTLTDAQVKALPTTPVTLVAAPGASKRIEITKILLYGKFSGGGYTNIGATASIAAQVSTSDITSYLANNPATPTLTDLSDFLSGAGSARPWSELRNWLKEPEDTVSLWGSLSRGEADAGYRINSALTLVAYNDALGDFTGGNGANSLQVVVHYSLEDVA